jgi:hypothetical protein
MMPPLRRPRALEQTVPPGSDEDPSSTTFLCRRGWGPRNEALLPLVVVVDPMDQLQRLVLGNASLCQTLLAITDRREFIVTVAAVARQHGVALDPAAIDDALDAARRSWWEHWV